LGTLKIVKSVVFSHFFDTLEATNTVNALGSPKPRYLRCFLASGSKHHGIYSVFAPVPSKKHWYLRNCHSTFSMLQDVVFICENRQ
jgi:hypothetical protein